MRSFFAAAIAVSFSAALVAVAVLPALAGGAPNIPAFLAVLAIALLLAAGVPALPLRRGSTPPALAILGLLALAACATAQVNEGKGLAAAQDAVAAAAQGVHQAYTAGVISKAQVQKADQLVDQADDLSKAARQAYAAGDATSAAGAIAQITTLATEIVLLEKPPT